MKTNLRRAFVFDILGLTEPQAGALLEALQIATAPPNSERRKAASLDAEALTGLEDILRELSVNVEFAEESRQPDVPRPHLPRLQPEKRYDVDPFVTPVPARKLVEQGEDNEGDDGDEIDMED